MNDISTTPAALVVFVVTIGASLWAFYRDQSLFQKWVLHPYSLVREKRWFTIITSGLLHGDWMHLIFNMMTFFFFAFTLEAIVGSFYFLIIYFGSMVISTISTIIKHKDDYQYHSLGASGAVSGAIFSAILFIPTQNICLYGILCLPAPLFGILYLIYCVWAAKKAQDYINHSAHFWGALAGIVITLVLIPGVGPYFIDEVTGLIFNIF